MDIRLENGKIRKLGYAYIKGNRYGKYSFRYEGDDEIKEVEKEFEELEQLMNFIISFSDYYDVPIQIYQ